MKENNYIKGIDTGMQQRPTAAQTLLRIPLGIVLLMMSYSGLAQKIDSVSTLKTIRVEAIKKPDNFSSSTPIQFFGRETLNQINAQSVGDAARYFSGALIKDYGGTGGLKTISVRSLGAANTGIIYDGIPVSDLQSGQIDLSRFSTTFVQSLELQQGSFQHGLLPARSFAAASALAINSNTFRPTNFTQQQWQAGVKAGSFNTWQPFAGIYQPLGRNTVLSVDAEALYADGDYPFVIDNGNLSGKSRRSNSGIKSMQGEANVLKQFGDSSTLQLKSVLYTAERGLPGAVIFFNNRSAQRLQNTDFFSQARYRKKLTTATTVLLSAKYSHSYTRYRDPDFLNNQGGLDSRYRQQEVYGSAAIQHSVNRFLVLSAASDLAFTRLASNANNFSLPRRISLWENIGLQYERPRWRAELVLLYNGISDHTATGGAASGKSKLTPTLAFSFLPSAESPFLLRSFYKAAFHMPTFNDLYYNFLGSLALRPEYAQQVNVGITYSKQFEGSFRKFNISADAYYNRIKDKIVAVPSQNLFVWTMLNLGRADIRGIDVNAETGGKVSAISWMARVAYTWQMAQDMTSKYSTSYKDRIPYTPDHSGSGIFSVSCKSWELGYNTLFSGSRYTLGENNPSNKLAGWMTQDVFLSRQLLLSHFKLHIKGTVSNISNQRYDVVRYYPMPGRSVNISLLFNNL